MALLVLALALFYLIIMAVAHPRLFLWVLFIGWAILEFAS